MRKYNLASRLSDNLNWCSLSKYRTELMGVAAIFIMIFHSTDFCSDLYTNYFFSPYLFFINDHLNIGVEIFLLVSGIGLYFSYEKKPKFKDYYIKRILNVYLILVLVRLVSNTITTIVFAKEFTLKSVISILGLRYIFGIDNTDWYIPFIMIMYLVFPLIYKFLKIIEKYNHYEYIVYALVILYVVMLILIQNTSFFKTYEIGLNRVPIFVLGCLFGNFVKQKKKFSLLFYITAVLGLLVKLLPQARNILIYERLSSIPFTFTIVLMLIFIFTYLPKFIMRFFAWSGNMSLELYIIHGVLYGTIMSNCEQLCNTYVYIITIIVAFILSIFVSKFRKYIVGLYVKRLNNKNN